mgnify:CR=1 FL=1
MNKCLRENQKLWQDQLQMMEEKFAAKENESRKVFAEYITDLILNKETDIHFRELWLAPLARGIHGYYYILGRKSKRRRVFHQFQT